MTTSTASTIGSSVCSTELPTRVLGDSDMRLTAIGFGAWAIGGGDWEFSWGAQDDSESIAAIERALDLGINWIDTAPIYGLGHSEEIVGKALKNASRKPYVFTKCGMRWKEGRSIYRSLKKDSVREEVESSLGRLQVDVIDLCQIHWPNPESEIEEAWETLATLKTEGKVRYIGISNFNVDQIKRLQSIAPVTSLQPPYSLLNRSIEAAILPYCAETNIGVINYSPMASGLLTGKMTAERIETLPTDDWRRRTPQFREPKLSRNLKLVELLREIGESHGAEPGVVSIAWTLRQPAVTAAIVGARRPEQVEGTIHAATFRLTEDELAKIDEFVQAHP